MKNTVRWLIMLLAATAIFWGLEQAIPSWETTVTDIENFLSYVEHRVARHVGSGSIRTFGKDVVPVAAFFSGFVSMIAYFLWWYVTKVKSEDAAHEVDSRMKAEADPKPEPPRLGECLILVFAQKKDTEAIVGDLAEIFDRELASGMTLGRAKARYWSRLLRSVGPQIWIQAKNVGLIGLIYTLLKR